MANDDKKKVTEVESPAAKKRAEEVTAAAKKASEEDEARKRAKPPNNEQPKVPVEKEVQPGPTPSQAELDAIREGKSRSMGASVGPAADYKTR